MGGAIEESHGQLHRVISVELPDPDNAEHLAQELSDHLPAAVIQQDGYWDVAIYGAGPDGRFIVDALDAVERWLRERGPAAVRVNVAGKTYLLDAVTAGESVAGG